MARLPRYRPLGIGVASLPSVNFAQTGQAQARVANTIASNLDRMSSFAFREAEVQAKLEGAEYGAANAPTAQQLEDATTPAEREELVPGGKGTVYDRAARSAAMETISLNLETAARKEITALRLTASASNMATSELQTKIDGVINGYSGALYDINPASSKRFRAGMSTVGNSAVVAHANKLAELKLKQDKVDAIAGIDTIKTSLSDIIANGDRVVDGVAVTLTDLLAAERSKVFDHAEKIGDPALLKRQLDDFDKIVSKEMIGVVSDWAAESPLARDAELMMGKISDKRIASIYKQMTPEQRRGAIEAVFSVTAKELQRESAMESKLSGDRKQNSISIRTDIAKEMNFPGSTGRSVSDMLAELEVTDPESFLTMSQSVYNSAGSNDPDAIIALNSLQANGIMTHQNLQVYLDNKKITFAEYQKRFEILESRRKEPLARAQQYIKNAINPVPSLFGPANDRKNAQIGQITNDLTDAMLLDPTIDPMNWVIARLKETEPAGPTKKEIDKAQSLVDSFAKNQGIPNEIVDVQNKLTDLISGNKAAGMKQYKNIFDAIETLGEVE